MIHIDTTEFWRVDGRRNVEMDKIVYDGVFKVWQTEVEIKGQKRIYEKIDVKNAVAGIILDEEGKLGLVVQYRPISKITTYEIPAGMVDKEATNLEILIEELEEECEINRNDIIELTKEPIISFHMLLGSSDSEMYIYEGKVKNQETKDVTDCDVERVEWVTLDEMDQLIKDKKIVDSKTMMVYYYLKSKQ